MNRVGLEFSGSARGAVGAAQQTAAAIAGVRREATGLGPPLRGAERDLGRVERGALAGSGALRGLGRSVAFASGGFLAADGFIAGMKGAIEQAEILEKAEASLGVVIRRNNGDVAEALPLIRKWAADQEQFGISVAEATQGLARAAAITGSVQAGMKAYDEALVISKATGKDFNAVLIAASKAQEGQTSALARYIGTVPKGTSVQQLFNEVMAKYEGQAKANTTASDKLHASISNIELAVGRALLPTVKKYEDELDSWLGKTRNQKRLTGDVTTAMHAMGGVIGGVVDVVKTADKVTGGFEHTLELLLGLKVARTLYGWKVSLEKLAAAEGAAAGGMGGFRLAALRATGPILAAAAAVLALDKAIAHFTGFDAIKKAWGSAGYGADDTADDTAIKVGGKWYVVGSSSAWDALIAAGWKPPKGVTSKNVTAAQEIGAAKSLGGSTHTADRGDGSRPGKGTGQGIQQGLVATAKTALGNAYQYGGAPSLSSPTDCSGLMVAVFAKHGIRLPRTSEAQYAQAPIKNARPLLKGDLVFSEGIHPGHVGLYIGDDKVLEDPHTGDHVKIIPLSAFGWNGESARWWGGKKTSHGGGHGDGAAPPTSPKVPKPQAAPQLPTRIQLAISKANADVAQAALTPGKADDRRAVAESKRALEEAIAWIRAKLKTNIGDKERITLEDLLTGYLNDLASLKGRKSGGASAGVIQGLRNQITADLRNLPAQLTPAEQVAINHLKQLKKKLVPGLDPKDLADIRAGIARWGKALRDAIKDQATKAAQAAQAAAEAAARLWQQGWQNAASTVMRDFEEQVIQPQLDKFDKETQAGLAALQAKYGAPTPEEQALAAFQAKRAADAEQKQKEDLLQQIADTEAQLAALQAGGSGGGTLIDIATGTRTGIPGDGTDPAAQQAALQQQLLELQDQYNQLQLDDQEAALQAAADQSRTAANQQLSDAQDAYQEQRDQQRQALQDMLDDQATALQQSIDDWEAAIEAKKKTWADFIAWLAANGYPTTGVTNPDATTDASTSPDVVIDVGPTPHPGLGPPGPPIAFAGGGKVPGRYVGRDTVPAFLTPGETVIDRRLSEALERVFLQGDGSIRVVAGDIYLDSYRVGRHVARPTDDAQRRIIGYTMQRG